MRRRRCVESALDRLYRPLRLRQLLPIGGGADGAAGALLSWWVRGVAVGTVVFGMTAVGLHAPAAWSSITLIVSLCLFGFFWAYALAWISRQPGVLRHLNGVLWVNSLVVLGLVTVMIGVTGAAASPLTWLWLVVTIADVMQNRRRGMVVAWLSWVLSGMVVLIPWMFADPVEPHALLQGLACCGWSAAAAIAVTVVVRWSARQAHAYAEQARQLHEHEHTLACDRARLQAEQQQLGQRLFQLDQARRQFEATQQRWEQERRQSECQRAEATQHLADQEAALAERIRQLEQRAEALRVLQEPFDEERKSFDMQRARATKLLDDREAELAERRRVLDEAAQQFEAQRTQTTQSLAQLERTLLDGLQRISGETVQLEAQRAEVERAFRELSAAQEQWASQRAKATEALQAQSEACAAQQQQLQAAQAALAQAQQHLRQREADVEAAARELSERMHNLSADKTQHQATLEARCRALEEQGAEVTAREQTVTRREETLQRQLDIAKRQTQHGREEFEAQRAQLATQRALVDAEHQRLVQELTQREQALRQRAQQLQAQQAEWDATHRGLVAQTAQLDAQRRALEQEREQWQRQRNRAAGLLGVPRAWFAQHTRRVLQAQAKKLREQHRRLVVSQRELSAREQQWQERLLQCTRATHELEAAQHQFDTERARLLAQLRQREIALAEQLQAVGETEHRLREGKAELLHAREQWEQEQHHRRSEQQTHEQSTAQELARLRHAVDIAQRVHAEAERHFETQRRQWEQAQAQLEETIATRERELTAHRRALAVQQQELTQAQLQRQRAAARSGGQTTQQRQQFAEQVRPLEARQQQVEAEQGRVEEQRAQLERQQQQLAQETTRREQELSARLAQLQILQRQVDEERGGLQRQQEQLDIGRRQLQQEQQQLDAARQQLHDSRRRLVEASASAQVPDRLSADALTLLANEFNAPMAGMHALLTALLEGDQGHLSEDVRASLREMTAVQQRLRRVVTDAIDAARIEGGQLPVSLRKVMLRDALARVEAEVRDPLTRKGLSLTREGPGTVALAVDPEQFHRILSALLRNAVEYTEQGGVTIRCALERQRAVVTVADTGIGISSDRIGSLFARPKLGALLHGKGISLYVARGLAKLMGGELTLVSSELGAGSTFAVTFPVAVPDPATERAQATSQSSTTTA